MIPPILTISLPSSVYNVCLWCCTDGLCMFIGPSEEIPGVPDDVDEEDESKFVSCPHNVCKLV